jgi:hypothetical protein
MTDAPDDRAMELARQALAEIMAYQRLSPVDTTELQALMISNAIRQFHIEEMSKRLAKMKALL